MLVRSTGLCRMDVVVAVARLMMDVLVFVHCVVVCGVWVEGVDVLRCVCGAM